MISLPLIIVWQLNGDDTVWQTTNSSAITIHLVPLLDVRSVVIIQRESKLSPAVKNRHIEFPQLCCHLAIST